MTSVADRLARSRSEVVVVPVPLPFPSRAAWARAAGLSIDLLDSLAAGRRRLTDAAKGKLAAAAAVDASLVRDLILSTKKRSS